MVNIEGQDKVALIDTEAGRCCMNEEHYQTLGESTFGTSRCGFLTMDCIWSFNTGNGFSYMCNMQIGGEDYRQQFIVCKQLTPGIILGRDFLSLKPIGNNMRTLRGVLQLRDSQDIPVQTAEEITTFPCYVNYQDCCSFQKFDLGTGHNNSAFMREQDTF